GYFRPFKDAIEYMNAVLTKGPYLHKKDSECYVLPSSVAIDTVWFPESVVCSYGATWPGLLEEYTFADGTPCGIWVEE
ncbi:MAG: hypothetical protein LIR46_09355, partial [Bacteroidota bacterium]|nr:hypothetical protein [Bacteroidota bacterium]